MMYVHGQSKNPLYKVWLEMVHRCHDTNHSRFAGWGGRGIEVCKEWRGCPLAFIDYVTNVLGPKPSSTHSLDRVNNSKGYEPGNLRWADAVEQNRNQRSNRWLTLGSKTMLMTDWAAAIGVTKSTLWVRLKNWTIEEALSTPSNGRRVRPDIFSTTT